MREEEKIFKGTLFSPGEPDLNLKRFEAYFNDLPSFGRVAFHFAILLFKFILMQYSHLL